MPIYEYTCRQGHTFEVMQRMTDDPLVSCQTCEAPVQRVFHPVAVHFKGSGFYNTDYGTRKRGRDEAAKSENGSKPESSSGSESKPASDSKPASGSKAESKTSGSAASSSV